MRRRAGGRGNAGRAVGSASPVTGSAAWHTAAAWLCAWPASGGPPSACSCTEQRRGVSGGARQVESPADRPARQQTDRPGWLGASCVCSSSGRRRLHSVRAAVLRGRSPPYVCGVAAVWCAVAAVSRIALTAWWRAVRDEAHQSVQPNDEAPVRDFVFRAGVITEGREVLELEHAILADVLPDSPAPAVCAAPAVQQSTHGGRRVVVGQAAHPESPILPAVVSKRRRDGQLSGRACSLESRYDRKGQFRDGVPPGLPGVKPTRTRPPEPRATPVLGRIVNTSPQAVIHLVAIHDEQQQAVRACAAVQGACRNDYGCYPRSSAEGVTTNHARFGAGDSRACMHAPRMTQGADV